MSQLDERELQNSPLSPVNDDGLTDEEREYLKELQIDEATELLMESMRED
jgi:hypothetical protein